MILTFSPNSLADYETFLNVKALPKYRIIGRSAEFPDEYASLLNLKPADIADIAYQPWPGLFDYQKAIAAMAIRRRKFAPFVDPGLGKTFIESEFARQAAANLPREKCVMILSPLMVIRQTLSEVERFYRGKFPIQQVRACELRKWIESGTSRVGITNYEALDDHTPQGRIGAIVCDESSCMKSAYGKWGRTILRIGRGLEWKMAATGTPAPNDRIEFANHAVFLDQFPNVNSFLARFFVNRGQTDNRWEMKPHALHPFYRALSHWSIFLNNPSTYGWKDNAGKIPPIHVHIDAVPLTDQQQFLAYESTGTLFVDSLGGICSRTTLGQLAKGRHKGEDVDTLKPAFIRRMIQSWPDESTIIWCIYDAEQDKIEAAIPVPWEFAETRHMKNGSKLLRTSRLEKQRH